MTRLFIRHTHPAGFRSGEWAEVLRVEMFEPPFLPPHPVFVVRFADMHYDKWAVYDSHERYEFTDQIPEGYE